MSGSTVSHSSITTKGILRDESIDLIRVVATILVVCVHCNGHYFLKPELGIQSTNWNIALSIASFSRICVPLFFMLTGNLLLKPDIVFVDFIRKRMLRLLPALLFWSGVYLLLRVSALGDRISLPSAVRLLYNGEVFYHLWFMYALIAVYAAIPFLSPLANNGRRQLLVAFFGIAFLLGSFLPFLDHHISAWTGYRFSCGIPEGMFWTYLGYVVAGALFRNLKCGKAGMLAAGFLLTTSTISTILLSLALSQQLGEPSESWMGYDRFLVVIAALSAFILLKSCPIPRFLTRKIEGFAGLSFGIYLAHPLVMKMIELVGFKPPPEILLGLPLYVMLVTLLSSMLVAGLRCFPAMRTFF